MTSLNENLNRIRELTDSVKPLHLIAKINEDHVIYSVEKGSCGGVALYKDEQMAIQLSFLGPDTILKNHVHDELEILICHEGDITVHMPGNDIDLERGGMVRIQPGTSHIAISKNGCRLVAITLPASDGYPNTK